MAVVHQNGFSTAVRIYLELAGEIHPVSQVGENILILKNAIVIQPRSSAHVIITVDGKRRVYPVIIREQVSQGMVIFDDADACLVSEYRNIEAST